MKIHFLIFTLLCISASKYIKAQQTEEQADTIILKEPPRHSPKKASIMSAAIPGLGQAYNKKYWKIPLVYAAIGTPLILAIDQSNQFQEFKDAYLFRVDDDPTTVDLKYDGVYTNENLLSLIDFHRRNRDLFYVLTGVAYILNVVDAAVDAHLYHFDISDDLSASIQPNLQFLDPRSFSPVPSLTFSLKFGKKPQAYRY